ncbi:disease resistance family protein / LRR family protein [Euphorbia peplus]|nr:disease resistance family protein / LRR family protein [Euphorbia peplus]
MANTSILFFSTILFIATLCLGGCFQTERVALLQFKNSLSDPSDRLSDWVPDGSDCCRWTGVVCHNITGNVLELHLRTLSPDEYFGLDQYFLFYPPDYEEYEEHRRKSAFGGNVSDSLLQLKRLSYLDLSYNNFGGISIPEFIGSLNSLRYLSLSEAGFGGFIPPYLGNLSNLHYLNLHGYMYDSVENLDWISSLSSLEFLDMSGIDLSRSFDWVKVMNSVPSLLELHLSGCELAIFNPTYLTRLNASSSLLVLDLSNNNFEGPIPNGLQNITSPFVTELDLSGNRFNSSIPKWIYDLTHLQLLNLYYNHIRGQISSSIENLTSLRTLDLHSNQLRGQISSNIGNLTSLVTFDMSFNEELEFENGIPNSFRNFCSLRKLYFSRVKLNQEINDVLATMSGCVSNVLQSLHLADCGLSGHLTHDLAYFKNLITFNIFGNSISGPIPSSFGELTLLSYLDLANNSLNGSLPVSFGNLKLLKEVHMSNNKMEGVISPLHFANLTRLVLFYASWMGKNVSLRVSSGWIPPLQLKVLGLGSWHIGSQFPDWLHSLKHLTDLDLSDSVISGPVPIWFWDSFPKYGSLNFSHNQMHGSIPNISFAGRDMGVIDLSSNKFNGVVPSFPSSLVAFDLSNNSFSGSIFNFLCNNMTEVKQMQVLNLERNLLDGEIPDCWRSWKYLTALRLSNNKFSGDIPNSIGTLSSLESLYLRNNNLSGEVPTSIQNCKKLLILDFSENNLVGNISIWIGSRFFGVSILSLHANNFDGYLPEELCHLVSLRILDLAHNNISGTIPSCFSNFTEMTTRNSSTSSFYASSNDGIFMQSAVLVMKGKAMEYTSNLKFVRSMDLSDNNLSGEIPDAITSLIELLSLNLSQNALTGRIPDNIGRMKGLEAIDFSHNKLSGEIPQSMSRLTFLGTLDVSYNDLSGRIPSGTQLQSFNSSNFIGNQLCGLPLIKNCSSDNIEPHIEEKDENEDEDEVDIWFYLSIVFGFVFGFSNVVGSLVFIKKWRDFCFGLGEKMWGKFAPRSH